MGSEQSLPVAAFSLGDSPVQLRGLVKPFMLPLLYASGSQRKQCFFGCWEG